MYLSSIYRFVNNTSLHIFFLTLVRESRRNNTYNLYGYNARYQIDFRSPRRTKIRMTVLKTQKTYA